MDAAPIDDVGARLLDPGDDRRIVLLALVDAFIKHFIQAERIEALFGFVGETLAIGRLVVEDGDLLRPLAAEKFRGDGALLIVAAAGAEDRLDAAFGDFRIGRTGRDLDDVVLGVDVRGRHGDAGIEMADDEGDLIADEFIGDRDALLWIGGVVADFDADLLAENAARRVDVGDGLFRAHADLRAECRVRTRDWHADAEPDFGGGCAAKAQCGQKADRYAPEGEAFHRTFHGLSSFDTRPSSRARMAPYCCCIWRRRVSLKPVSVNPRATAKSRP